MKVLLDAVHVDGEVVLILTPDPMHVTEREREDWPDPCYYFELSKNGLLGSSAKLAAAVARVFTVKG